MNLLELLKIIRANLLPLLGIPVVTGILVMLLTSDSPKKYSSSTKIYTGIASGYSIESQQNGSFNYFAINNAFDNMINLITSRRTMEETALKLYALHLMQDEPKLPVITYQSINEIKQITPPEIFDLVDKNSLDNTYNNLLAYKNKDESNHVYKLINLTHPHYSFKAISKIRARRIANSDMIEISYESDDPAVCYQVLKLLVNTFIDNYSSLKENQTDAVVEYFEGQLEIAHNKLQKAESKLLDFNMDNRIINYYEQTKHIASEKEKFEVERQSVMLDYAAAESVIKNLESEMGTRVRLKLQGSNIIKLRNELNRLNEKLALHRFNRTSGDSATSEALETLILKSDTLKQQLQASVDSLHFYENTREGLKMDEVVNNWLINVIAYEEAGAKLNALEIRRNELQETIQHFAPLGANLKKIEREIDVVEREYLSLLHSLSLAKLKQQDIQLSSNIKIVDPPVLPISPLPGKRKFLILAAMMAGFIMTIAVILLMYFFDTTLRNTDRAEKASGLSSLGNFPLISNKNLKTTDIEGLKVISVNAIVNNLLRWTAGKGKSHFKIAVVSHYPGEGKSLLIDAIQHQTGKGTKTFEIEEIPALMGRLLPESLEKPFDIICYVIRADRGWETADKKMLEVVQKVNPAARTGFILNAVKLDDLGDFIGPVPKNRSGFRRLIKRMVQFRFFQQFELKQNEPTP